MKNKLISQYKLLHVLNH